MSFVIYKYPVTIIPVQNLILPKGASIIKCGETSAGVFVWALHEKDAKDYVKREIWIYGTGNPIETLKNKRFIETIIDKDEFIWHFFDGGEL